MGRKLGFSTDKKNFHIVSLGQGQEVVAEEAMGVSAVNGHWVILQNVHLVAKWLATLEKKMEETFENPLPDYRFVFLTRWLELVISNGDHGDIPSISYSSN